MDYKKEYEEMVQRVKELHETGNFLTKKQMELICPQLAKGEDPYGIDIPFGAYDSELIGWEYTIPEGMEAVIKDGKIIVREQESEDERIRKNLVEYHKQQFEKNRDQEIGLFHKDAIAYLGKQKENPKSADSIPPDCTSDVRCEDRWHKATDSLPDNGREVLAKDKLGNTLLARYDGEGWDVSVYDDEDYRCHNGISKWCEIPSEKQKEPHYTKRNALFDKCVENCDPEVMKRVSDEIDELLEKEQKPDEIDGKALLHVSNKSYDIGFRDGVASVGPVEWSEEDSDNLERVDNYMWMLDDYVGDDCAVPQGKTDKIRGNIQGILSPWLKSLPERFNLQPKNEWSDEDEMMATSILNVLKRFEHLGATDMKIDWLQNKLKSLRPQPSWKPSEDEERMIKTSISFLKDFADKGYENAVECIDWLKSKLNGNSC